MKRIASRNANMPEKAGQGTSTVLTKVEVPAYLMFEKNA